MLAFPLLPDKQIVKEIYGEKNGLTKKQNAHQTQVKKEEKRISLPNMQIDKIVLRVDNDLLDWQSNLVQWDKFSALVLGLKHLSSKNHLHLVLFSWWLGGGRD